MARLELAGYLDDDGVETPPIPSSRYPDGHVYRVASPSAATGLKLAAMAELGVRAVNGQDVDSSALELDDEEEVNLYRMVLGATLDEMVDDGVSWLRILKLGRYLFVYFAMGEDTAAAMLGKAEGPNRAARRAPSATATTTPRQGSTSGTSSRRKPPAKRATRARA